ncbi:DNA polymerase III epsilon subunit [Pseudoalteromonas luteoviolacea B = ATCC 29581]|nr:DNA polymerase III epsilon subunit [Pseudoalteromonas luteoviolacea B = ATCC 29581]
MLKGCLYLARRWWQRKRLLKQPFLDLPIVVIDLELTGLDAKQNEIVSAAWVKMEAGRIQLASSAHLINAEVNDLAQSPIYHGICADDMQKGVPTKQLASALAEVMHNAIVVFHHSYLDMAFIRVLFHQYQYVGQPVLILDTMQIERKRLLSQGFELGQDSLTLDACRTRYGLPQYTGHHALTDAVATAELLLAQCHKIGQLNELKFQRLV